MFAVDSRSLCLLGGTFATVLAGVYVVFGPPKRQKKPNRPTGTCPGLVNLGNTCFLNAVLQAVAPCTSVVHWLDEFVIRRQDYGKYLATTLNNVFKVLNNSSIEYTEEYCPTDVISALQARRWVIPQGEQDAHELFHVLTETLDEESTKCGTVLSLFDIDQLQENAEEPSEVTVKNRINVQVSPLPRKGNDHPFKGLLASQLQCSTCFYKYPVKYDTFDSISLNLPDNFVGAITIDHLLRQYIMSEVVQNVDCFGCAKKCGLDAGQTIKSTFIKKMTIGKLPQCLCLHIQRNVWMGNGMPMKRFERVTFPEILNMGEYVYLNSETRKKSMFLSLASLDNDFGTRLVGGRKNGVRRMSCRSPGATSPTVSIPYSGPVNVLKALNYHIRSSMAGLSAGTTADDSVDQSSTSVQRLAQAYSTETFSPINTNHAYKLSSVVIHLGDVFSGHFVTYRRVPTSNGQRFPDRWLYTSDTVVKKATLSEVLQANAYMLFYEKI